jgi:hypothetical protein
LIVQVSRKIVYPFFILVFGIIFFILIFSAFFSEALAVEDISISSASSTKPLMYFTVVNKSTQVLKDVYYSVYSGGEIKKNLVGGGVMNPLSKVEIVVELPDYTVREYGLTVEAQFVRPKKIVVPVQTSTYAPVEMTVNITNKTNMTVGVVQEISILLCNKSQSSLAEIVLNKNYDAEYFNERAVPIRTPLNANQCKTIESGITPKKVGQTQMTFELIVGSMKRQVTETVTIN